MKKVFSVGIVLLVVLLVAIGCGVPSGYHEIVTAQRDSAEAQLQVVQSELDSTKSQLRAVQSELDAAKSQSQPVQSDDNTAKSQLQSVQNELSLTKASCDRTCQGLFPATLPAKVCWNRWETQN